MAKNTKYVSKPLQNSFPHLFVATNQFDPSKPKFSVILLVPKTDTDEIARINACYEAAIEDGIQKKFNGKAPNKSTLRPVLKDGDESDRPEFKGHYLLTCSSTQRPQVVDINLNEIIEPNAIVGGDYIRVSCNFAAYNVGASKGVSCYLQNVQLYKKTDKPFGGRSTAESDFATANNGDFI